MVKVPWSIDAAVRLALLSTCVVPLPVILPITCVPSVASKVADEEVKIFKSLLVTFVVFKMAVPDSASMSDVPLDVIPPEKISVPPVTVVLPA